MVLGSFLVQHHFGLKVVTRTKTLAIHFKLPKHWQLSHNISLKCPCNKRLEPNAHFGRIKGTTGVHQAAVALHSSVTSSAWKGDHPKISVSHSAVACCCVSILKPPWIPVFSPMRNPWPVKSKQGLCATFSYMGVQGISTGAHVTTFKLLYLEKTNYPAGNALVSLMRSIYWLERKWKKNKNTVPEGRG